MMSIRKMLEEREKKFLSPFAQLSSESRGRKILEDECSIRPAFQHDRDRIIHSKSFRRLKHKTQVFLTPTGDHYRTRLTHTLEVSQIARTLAKALALNEDLTEAIALGHDLGHTPFGHAGEEILNEICPGGFHHAAQSLRVVDFLEKDGKGLNLTFEVRDGILKHSKGKGDVIPEDPEDAPCTYEGRLVRIADIIAYINHDIDDAMRAELISPQDIPRDCVERLGESHGQRIDSMVRDILEQAQDSDPLKIGLSEGAMEATVKLRNFLYDRVYDLPEVHGDFIKSAKIIRELHAYFLEGREEFRKEAGEAFAHEPVERAILDFIAGMTDRYAIKLYEKIFLPQPWLII
ncbi:MAG: deoxyguanosinetriphosphate triphosphohydrolase [Deltaproteobacteria bacterium RBG_13_51_10]|nr:MAG: deoxyguanosinetriphosphate triphosphohydrolase [Deltaproteobacteria bacterium RBG_13_51_10]